MTADIPHPAHAHTHTHTHTHTSEGEKPPGRGGMFGIDAGLEFLNGENVHNIVNVKV